MTATAQTYRDIFNDAVKDSVKRATDAAALYNAGASEKAAYREFRAEWDKSVDDHRAAIQAQLQNGDIVSLYKKIDSLLDSPKFDADAVKSALDDMSGKVAAEAKLLSKLDVERVAMTQAMNGIKMAEKGMRRFPEDRRTQSRQTSDKLLDRGTLDRLEQAAAAHRDNYLDIAQKALEKTVSAQDRKQTRAQAELGQYLDGRPATAKPMTAPATARFRRKPQVQP